MGTDKTREEKRQWILLYLDGRFKKGENVNLQILLSNFAYQQYSTERTCREFLKTFQKLKMISIKEEEIYKGKKWKLKNKLNNK